MTDFYVKFKRRRASGLVNPTWPFKCNEKDPLHLLENTIDRKRIYTNPSSYPSPNSNTNPNPPPKAQ